MDFLYEAFHLEWRQAIVDLCRVALAFALAMPVAWERFRSDRNLGLRTFPIVAMASCGFVLIAKPTAEGDPETLARILQGLLSGIGFIGGGAILKRGSNVKGLATGASIWCTGAIGAAVAYEREEIAAVLSLITFLALRCLTPVVKESQTMSPKKTTSPQRFVAVKNPLSRKYPTLLAANASGARSILSAIAGSMITVAGVTFSITIVALSVASNQYTPRILRNFMSDTGNQVVLGAFVSVFIYSLVVLRETYIRNRWK